MSGTVEGIAIASAAGETLRALERVEAISGVGLEGDRYASGRGKFSRGAEPGESDITLVSAEALEALAAEHGIELDHLQSRRNILVRGIDLNALVGVSFSIGEKVRCIGRELAEPCTYLESLTEPGVLRGLVHRGGLRGGVEIGGPIEIGDAVRAV